jgi:hypothetical protein
MPTSHCALVAGLLISLGGCASLPPGSAFPRPVSVAFAYPEETRIGGQFTSAALAHGGDSAFHIISVGVDRLLIR